MRKVIRCGLHAITITLGLVQVAACSPKTALDSQGQPASADMAKPASASMVSPDNHAAPDKPVAANQWPETKIAQRDFPATAFFVDERNMPRALWLISASPGTTPEAMEFFTARRASDVRVETGPVASYSFTDAQGRRHASVRVESSGVDSERPSIYAGWEQGGIGHDVVLGAYLFENKGSTGPDAIYSTKPVPTDPKRFFGDQPVCEPVVYVARTQGSQSRDSEADFEPRTKIVASYDDAKRCWSSRPLHALDLQDNTFVLATATHVVRLNSKDLTPVGSAPDIRIIDVKEE